MHSYTLKSTPTPRNNVSFFFEHICTMRSENHFVFPPIQAPSSMFLDGVGKEMLMRIVLRHHGLMRKMTALTFKAQEYHSCMEEVTKIAHFMLEALGCSTVYTNEYGINAINTTQPPFSMNEKARELWLQLYAQTLKDLSFPKKFLAEFWNWIELFSLRILNTSTLQHLPKRYYFESIQKAF